MAGLGEEAVLELVDPLDELVEPLLALVLVEPEPVVRGSRSAMRAAVPGLDSAGSSSIGPTLDSGPMADRGSFHLGYAIDPATGKPGADEVVDRLERPDDPRRRRRA